MSQNQPPKPPLAMMIILDIAWILGAIIVFSAALTPVYFFLRWIWTSAGTFWAIVSVPVAYFIFLYALIAAITLVRLCIPHLPPGVYKMASPDHLKLYLHMGLCNYVFTTGIIHHIQLMGITRWLFYRGVGMKLDRSTMIAPGALVRDTNVISVGRNSLIGGHAFVIGHVATSTEEFIVGRVEIGDNVIIGGCASLSPGNKIADGALVGPFAILLPMVEVGANSRVLPNSVVTTGTKIPPGEMWGGTPARKIRDLTEDDLKKIAG